MARTKRRRFHRRRTHKKNPTVKALAKKVKEIAREPEIKYIDGFNVTGTPVVIQRDYASLFWNSVLLNPSVPGNTFQSRIGTEILGKKLNIRCRLAGAAKGLGEARIRVFIFWYKNSNALVPAAYQLMDNGGGLGVPLTFAHYNREYADSFKVIHDRTYILKPLDWDGDATPGTGLVIPDIININKTFHLHRKVKYTSNTTFLDQRDILDNSLWICFTTSANYGANTGNPATDFNPTFELSSRFSYTDC